MANTPIMVTPENLAKQIRDHITEYYPQLSYTAIKVVGDEVVLLRHKDMSEVYGINAITGKPSLKSEFGEKRYGDFKQYLSDWEEESFDQFKQLLKAATERYNGLTKNGLLHL